MKILEAYVKLTNMTFIFVLTWKPEKTEATQIVHLVSNNL